MGIKRDVQQVGCDYKADDYASVREYMQDALGEDWDELDYIDWR